MSDLEDHYDDYDCYDYYDGSDYYSFYIFYVWTFLIFVSNSDYHQVTVCHSAQKGAPLRVRSNFECRHRVYTNFFVVLALVADTACTSTPVLPLQTLAA